MLIRFRVSNFLSFKEQVELSMIAGASQQHSEHVLRAGKSGIDVLRCALVYGANASGKSNLIKAAAFAREFIIEGVKPKERIALKPFKLDKAMIERPTKFEFEFQREEKCYLYGFELTPVGVKAEWLYKIKKTTEKMLFERSTDVDGNTDVNIGLKLRSAKDQNYLKEFSSGTRPNQLFLTKCYEDNKVNYFDDVVKWFQNLVIIFPGSKYIGWIQLNTKEIDKTQLIVEVLKAFDTGICGFATEEIKYEGVIPGEIIEDFQNDKNITSAGIINPKGIIYYLSKEGEEIHISKIVMKHQVDGCESDVAFDMDEESDGTLRLVDLIPILLSREKVFLVDEIDRSLHPSLSYKFTELFLSNSSDSQIIVTTHEAHLLELALLRRDEIWFTEKDRSGASTLYSLEEFAPRHDKDIQKGYLMGRYGAIPVMSTINFLGEEEHA